MTSVCDARTRDVMITKTYYVLGINPFVIMGRAAEGAITPSAASGNGAEGICGEPFEQG